MVTVAANNSTGDVYVTDGQHGAVDVFDSSGSYLEQIPGIGPERPIDVSVDQVTGDVYVAYESNLIDVFNPATNYELVRQITGAGTPKACVICAAGQFIEATSVAVDDVNADALRG